MNRQQAQPTVRIQIDKLKIPANRGLHTQHFISLFRAELHRALTNNGHHSHIAPRRSSKQAVTLPHNTSTSTTQLARETAKQVARQLHVTGHFNHSD